MQRDEGGPEEFARQEPFRKLVTDWLRETMGSVEADNVGKTEFLALVRLAERAAGMSAEGGEAKSEPSLSEINELAKTYASSYASPHHITFTVEGLRNLIAASPKAGESRTEPDCVKASGEAQLLHEAHDQLHRLVATFVPGNDGAYTETTDLMRRIREALPGVAFDGGTDGVEEGGNGR